MPSVSTPSQCYQFFTDRTNFEHLCIITALHGFRTSDSWPATPTAACGSGRSCGSGCACNLLPRAQQMAARAAEFKFGLQPGTSCAALLGRHHLNQLAHDAHQTLQGSCNAPSCFQRLHSVNVNLAICLLHGVQDTGKKPHLLPVAGCCCLCQMLAQRPGVIGVYSVDSPGRMRPAQQALQARHPAAAASSATFVPA